MSLMTIIERLFSDIKINKLNFNYQNLYSYSYNQYNLINDNFQLNLAD